jgi:hypothetical protein
MNYSVVCIPSLEGTDKVAFGIFGHRPSCELSNIRKQDRNSVPWDTGKFSADKNYVMWSKSKNITYSEKRLALILHTTIYIWLEFKFVENHTDSHSQSLSKLTQTARLYNLRIFLSWNVLLLEDNNTSSTHIGEIKMKNSPEKLVLAWLNPVLWTRPLKFEPETLRLRLKSLFSSRRGPQRK